MSGCLQANICISKYAESKILQSPHCTRSCNHTPHIGLQKQAFPEENTTAEPHLCTPRDASLPRRCRDARTTGTFMPVHSAPAKICKVGDVARANVNPCLPRNSKADHPVISTRSGLRLTPERSCAAPLAPVKQDRAFQGFQGSYKQLRNPTKCITRRSIQSNRRVGFRILL